MFFVLDILLAVAVFFIGATIGVIVGFKHYDIVNYFDMEYPSEIQQQLSDEINKNKVIDEISKKDKFDDDLPYLGDLTVEELENLDKLLYFKRTTVTVADIPYELNNTYFIQDKDGYGYSISKELYEKYETLFDGDEQLEIWFYSRGMTHMYRRITNVGLMSMINPE